MKKFEAVILFSPDLSSNIIEKELEFFSKQIKDTKGEIISQEDWGLRDLSYKINNYKKAFYRFYQIEVGGENIENIKRILTQNEKILRHLFVRVEEHQQLPTKMIANEEK